MLLVFSDSIESRSNAATMSIVPRPGAGGPIFPFGWQPNKEDGNQHTRRWEEAPKSCWICYHTSTGPLGTGIAVRCATPGSCMKLATIGGG